MHMLCYTSHYTGSDITSDLKKIMATSKKNNLTDEITGVLFYHNGSFIQVIEGEKNHLIKLMNKIQKDSRHNKVSILIDKEINKRYLSHWNMDSFNISDKEQLDLEELEKVRDAFEQNILPQPDALIQIFKLLIEKGAFRQRMKNI